MTHNRRTHKTLSVLFTIIVVATLCCQVAFADSNPQGSFQSGIDVAYNQLRWIATGGGVLALAGCGIILVTGSEKDGEKAKAAIKYIIIAVVGVWILPLVVRAGKGMFGTPWNPHSFG